MLCENKKYHITNMHLTKFTLVCFCLLFANCQQLVEGIPVEYKHILHTDDNKTTKITFKEVEEAIANFCQTKKILF